MCLQLDLPLSLVFYKWLLGQEHTLTAAEIRHVDPVLAKSFQQLDDLLRQKKRIDADRSHVGRAKESDNNRYFNIMIVLVQNGVSS